MRYRFQPGRAMLALFAVVCSAGFLSPTAPVLGQSPSAAEASESATTESLGDIIAQLPALLSGTAEPGTEFLFPVPGPRPSVAGYAGVLLSGRMRLAGLPHGHLSVELPPNAAPNAQNLPSCVLKAVPGPETAQVVLLSATRADTQNGWRLTTSAYRLSDGSRVACIEKLFNLPDGLKPLANGTAEPMSKADADWLELLRAAFQSHGALPPSPREILSRDTGLYLMERGLWDTAALETAGLAEDVRSCGFLFHVFCLGLSGNQKALDLVSEALKKAPDSGPLYALNAWLQLRGEHPGDALPMIEQARRSDVPREGLYVYAHGLIAAERGQHDIAEQDFVRASELLPTEPFVQIKVARLHRAKGRDKEALKAYRLAAGAQDATLEMQVELALALDGAGESEAATIVLRRALDLHPGNGYAARALSDHFTNLGRHNEALAVLEQAARRTACDAGLYLTYGDAAARIWRTERAIDAYLSAKTLMPDRPRVAAKLAALHRTRREYPKAVEVLDAALSTFPHSVDLLVEKARMLAELDRMDEARALLDDAATQPEGQLPALLALTEISLMRETAENYEQALRHAQMAVATDASSRTLAALARAQLANGKAEKAVSAARSALEENPSCAASKLVLAKGLLRTGFYAEAHNLAQDVMRGNPFNVEALEIAGDLALQADDAKGCVERWQRALELNPWHAALHKRLADVLATRLGDRSAAASHYERAAELQRMRNIPSVEAPEGRHEES